MTLQEKIEKKLQKGGLIIQTQEGEILAKLNNPAVNLDKEVYRVRIVDDQIYVSQPGMSPLVFTDFGMFSYWLDI